MKYRNKLNHSILFKIVLVNLLLIFIFGILLLFNNNYIKHKLKEKQYTSNINYINYISNLIERDLRKISDTANLLKIDNSLPILLNFNLDNYNHNLYNYNKSLVKYERSLPYYSKIYIYFNNNDLITSSDGIRNRKVFNEILHSESEDFNPLDINSLITKKGYTIYNNFILYTYPYNNLMFIIKTNKSNIKEFLNNSEDLFNNKIAIVDKENKIFVSNIDNINNFNDLDKYTKNDHLSIITKDKNNLKYNIIYSNNPLQQDITHTNIYTFILLFIITAINTLFILYNIYLYHPIKEIVNSFSNSTKLYDKNKNELDQISDIIHTLYNDNNNLANQNKYLTEHQLFLQLLHNEKIKGNSSLINNLNLKYKNYVILTNIIEDENGKRNITFSYNFESIIKNYSNFEKIIYSPDIDTYIISNANLIDTQKILDKLFECVNNNKNIFIRCGISNIHNNITELNIAIEESIISIKKCKNNLNSNYTLCYYNQINNYISTPIEISIEDQQKLISSMLNGNTKYIKSFFNNEIPKIIINASFEQVKNTYRYLYNLLYIVIYSKQMNINKIKKFIVINFNDSNNLTYMNNAITNNYSQVALYIKQQKKSLYDKILDYIDEYYDKDLCLTDIATHFSISTVYLSSYFKKNSGSTINNYINSIKIKHAKNIIKDNRELNINEVAEQLGYINIGTFIRHFKKYTGYTPNQYKQFL